MVTCGNKASLETKDACFITLISHIPKGSSKLLGRLCWISGLGREGLQWHPAWGSKQAQEWNSCFWPQLCYHVNWYKIFFFQMWVFPPLKLGSWATEHSYSFFKCILLIMLYSCPNFFLPFLPLLPAPPTLHHYPTLVHVSGIYM